MKGGTVQISWHGSDPVLSVDFHPTSGLLATAGADRDIKLWSLHHVEKSKALPTATFRSNLSYHSSAVNVVRFSPSGELIASGADLGELVIWRLVQVGEETPSWKVWKTLRFHMKDVLDLEWSRDGAFLVSASVDNTCIIWDVNRGSVEQVLSDHQHYVQGVTWDPAGEFVVSLSSDRTCRIYSARLVSKKGKGKEKKEEKGKKLFECKHVLFKKDAASSAASNGDDVLKPVTPSKQYLFYDENMASFFRRLSWSPDGSFLLLPAGVEKQTAEAAPCSLTYIVSRKELSKSSPQLSLQLPAGSKPVIGARFCPVRFALRTKKQLRYDTNGSEMDCFELPYRLVFAVATLSSVFIYETQGSCPIAVFSGLHYAPITDLAWSSEGKFLAVSSQDGYCTLIAFDKDELGVPVPLEGCKLGGNFKTSPSTPCSGRTPQLKRDDDVHTEQKCSSNLASNTPVYVSGTNGVSPSEALKTMNIVKPSPMIVKMRRVTPKATTDALEVPATASHAGLCEKDACSMGLQNFSDDQKTGEASLSRQSIEPPNSTGVPEESSSSHPVVPLVQVSVTDSLFSSNSLLQACVTGENTCKADQVMSLKGPAIPCSSKQMESSKLDETPKPSEERAHIYVRPLKFRRISPKPVVEESSPVTSKPLTC